MRRITSEDRSRDRTARTFHDTAIETTWSTMFACHQGYSEEGMDSQAILCELWCVAWRMLWCILQEYKIADSWRG